MDEQSEDLSLLIHCLALSLARTERNLASNPKIIDSKGYLYILQGFVLVLHMFYVDLMNQETQHQL